MPMVFFFFPLTALVCKNLDLFFFLFDAVTGLTQIWLYLWQGFGHTESTTVTTRKWTVNRYIKAAYYKTFINSTTMGIKVGKNPSWSNNHSMVKELTGRPMRRGCRVAWLPLQLSPPPPKKTWGKKMLPRQEEDTKRERWFSNSWAKLFNNTVLYKGRRDTKGCTNQHEFGSPPIILRICVIRNDFFKKRTI